MSAAPSMRYHPPVQEHFKRYMQAEPVPGFLSVGLSACDSQSQHQTAGANICSLYHIAPKLKMAIPDHNLIV